MIRGAAPTPSQFLPLHTFLDRFSLQTRAVDFSQTTYVINALFVFDQRILPHPAESKVLPATRSGSRGHGHGWDGG